MIVQERRYKEKLVKFAQELENVGKRKSKNKERLYQAGMQIKATLNGLIDMIREHIASKHETLSLKILKPLLEQLHSKCDILESLVVDSLHPQRDQTLKVKYFKRKHNFDRFRKELKDLIHTTLHSYFESAEQPVH